MLNLAFSRMGIILAIAFMPVCVFPIDSADLDVSTAAIQSSEKSTEGDSVYSESKTPGDVLIFVSFSMPESSLKQWFTQANKIKAPVIIRGLVNDSFRETQAKIAEVSPENMSGVVMDPRLFQTYQIQKVPAVVVRDTSVSCASGESCLHQYPFDVIYGDVDLGYALQTIAKQGDSAGSVAERVLQQFKENNS